MVTPTHPQVLRAANSGGKSKLRLGEASGAEQDQYAFPLEVAVLPAVSSARPRGCVTMEPSPHPEAHQPQPLAVTTPPGSQLSLHSLPPGRPSSSSCQEHPDTGVFNQGPEGDLEGRGVLPMGRKLKLYQAQQF